MGAKKWIRRLGLKKHPEGGYYRETYRSSERIDRRGLPTRYRGGRHLSTAIYYLLPQGQFSAFHRIQSDEIWHFYEGDPLTLFLLLSKGRLVRKPLGRNLSKGESPQVLIPRGTWFAAAVISSKKGGTGYALAGCTVAPGFDFSDFEMARRETLLKKYPARRRWILRLTKDSQTAGKTL